MSNFAIDFINDQVMDMSKGELIHELSTGFLSRIKLIFLSEYQLRVLMKNELTKNDYYDKEINHES